MEKALKEAIAGHNAQAIGEKRHDCMSPAWLTGYDLADNFYGSKS